MTVLKSPHVNKTAQEQFESFVFSRQLTIYLTEKPKYLFYLKKIQESLFSDVKLKIKFSLNKMKNFIFRLSIFNPSNFNLNINKKYLNQTYNSKKNITIKKLNNNNNKKIKHFIKIFDSYGELNNLKNKV